MATKSSNIFFSSNRIFWQKVKALVHFVFFMLILSLFFNNCSNGSSSDSNSSFSVPPEPYCPYLPSKTFSDAVLVSGRAVYEFRVNGNGPIANGIITLMPVVASGAQAFDLSINSHDFSWQAGVNYTASDVISNLMTAVNNDAAADMIATANGSALVLTPKNEAQTFNLSTSSNLKRTRGDFPQAIRFAEISISDSSGQIIQCAESDSMGNFNFSLPKSNAQYLVSIHSRANNLNLQAYVLQDPVSNQSYAVSSSITAAHDLNKVNLIAPAQGSLEGGAFNILDQLARANVFLRNFTSSAQGCGSATFPDCTPFVVGPLVQAFWKKGFNPGAYEGLDPNSGISYYLPGKSQLFIMGGINGDVNYSDTDHFDNSVIIHEYGHFMEDHYGKSDSPGGSHDGFSQLDPRLAWSEGWADFFQASVTGNPVYRDTYGNEDGTAGVFFNEDIEHLTANSADQVSPNPNGEGIYHEFSITRLLWDAIDPHPVSGAGSQAPDENIQSPFAEIWSVFNGSSQGFRTNDQHFRNMGSFHLMQNAKSGHSDWSSLRQMEHQSADRKTYGAILNTSNCFVSSIESISPVASLDGDYFRNDRFYSYYHPGGKLDLQLSYSTPSGALADLDLFVYSERHYLGDNSSRRASSESSPPLNCTSTTQCSERIVADLNAGFYLINVSATPSASGLTNFSLKLNSNPGCITY